MYFIESFRRTALNIFERRFIGTVEIGRPPGGSLVDHRPGRGGADTRFEFTPLFPGQVDGPTGTTVRSRAGVPCRHFKTASFLSDGRQDALIEPLHDRHLRMPFLIPDNQLRPTVPSRMIADLLFDGSALGLDLAETAREPVHDARGHGLVMDELQAVAGQELVDFGDNRIWRVIVIECALRITQGGVRFRHALVLACVCFNVNRK